MLLSGSTNLEFKSTMHLFKNLIVEIDAPLVIPIVANSKSATQTEGLIN